MGITKPTATLFFDTRNRKQSGAFPVKLTVYYLKKKKRYRLPFEFTIDEWRKLNSPKLRDSRLKDARTKLDSYVNEKFQNALIKTSDPFTFVKFETIYFADYQESNNNVSVYDAFDAYIRILEQDDKIGTSIFYTTAKKSFQKYRRNLKFQDVTIAFLTKYEEYMLSNGRSYNYISMNLRCLRAIYNQAIVKGHAKQDSFPFTQKRAT